MKITARVASAVRYPCAVAIPARLISVSTPPEEGVGVRRRSGSEKYVPSWTNAARIVPETGACQRWVGERGEEGLVDGGVRSEVRGEGVVREQVGGRSRVGT